MIFSSNAFIFRFLAILITAYLIIPGKYKNLVFLVGSLIFYGIGEPIFVWIMMGSLVINYLFAKRLLVIRRKRYVAIPVILDLLLLGVYKYYNFAADNINHLFVDDVMPVFNIVLPIGISFYTFQMISFVVDCYRGDITGPIRFIDTATYIVLFPQLVAGPIVKYSEISNRLMDNSKSIRDIDLGMRTFTVGLALKVLVANQIGTLWKAVQTAGVIGLSTEMAWLGAFACTMQLYFDFWGYSLMAIGLGKMIGFKIPLNFDNPYVSTSISEFWRRWHMTLGRWFKEYVYIPLGGNRKGVVRTIINTFIVWALTGLWHGADWNFILWGLTFFVLISLEKIGLGKLFDRFKWLGHIYVLFVMPVAWILFSIPDLRICWKYILCMFGHHGPKIIIGFDQFTGYLSKYGLLMIICVVLCTPYPIRFYNKYKHRGFMIPVLLVLFIWSVVELMMGVSNPFLYYRF
ncbi:MAG: MBOAT family protein [Pseudobutyrivibrio sp.]|nr:MBOAT family protein [Pseudobutyrivibrio sp.]